MNLQVNKKQIEKFVNNYNIGKLISCQRMKKGFGNLLYKIITNKGTYILKIVVRNNPVRVIYEVDLLNHIKKLPTPQTIPSKDKKILLNFNATNKAFIYKYIEGKVTNVFNDDLLFSIGKFLGELHKQSIKFKSNIKRLEFYNISKKSFREMIEVSKETKNLKIKNAVHYIKNNFLQYSLPKNLPQGAIHIDLKPENVLIKNKKLSGVIDFDNSYIGPLILDLANTLMWFCSKNGKFNFKKAKIIFEGYTKKRKISPREKKYFYNVFHYVFLSHMLVDIYLLVSKKDRLNQKYIYWGIDNLLKTEKNIKLSQKEFNIIFKIS